MMNSLERALIDLAGILSANNVPYMIIGGIANAVWGEPRSTIDIDATIWLEEENIDRIIPLMSGLFHPLIQDYSRFVRDTNVLPLESRDGVRVDLIFGRLPYEYDAIQRAVVVDIEGVPVRFCTPEDLILHKIISDRQKDINDAHGVAVRRMKSLDLSYLEPRILELSNTMEKSEIWESWEQWKKSLEKNRP
jgi:hypothetical protein